jgi:hypothetical protein
MPHSRIGIVHFSDALNTIRYSIFLGEEYLIQHAETLKYNVGKAHLAKKRKHRAHKNIDAGSDTVVESNSVTPIASCQTTVQAANTEHVKDVGQMKGQEKEQVLGEHDKPAACCKKQAVRTKIVSENRDSEEESGETAESEQVLEEHDVPVENKFDIIVEAIKKLIKLSSLEDVKKALAVAEIDV